jgi:hypothetical protein
MSCDFSACHRGTVYARCVDCRVPAVCLLWGKKALAVLLQLCVGMRPRQLCLGFEALEDRLGMRHEEDMWYVMPYILSAILEPLSWIPLSLCH